MEEEKKELKDRTFNDVFTFSNLFGAYLKCRSGVEWKSGVQLYSCNAMANIYKTLIELRNGTYETHGFNEFKVHERGKERDIKSVSFSERIVQRCLCDEYLMPLLSKTFIYDNGACQKGKGTSFSRRRLKRHLTEHFRSCGTEGYILQFDFSKYFDNIDHDVLKGILSRQIRDERLRSLTFMLIDDFGPKGLGLGSQISQASALKYADEIDHYVKEVCGIRAYGRYMDDGYLISDSKEKLEECLRGITEICDRLGIRTNPKKTHLARLSKGFVFLKKRFLLTESGRVVVKPARTIAKKEVEKLKTFAKWIKEGKMTKESAIRAYCSWRGSLRKEDSRHALNKTDKAFHELISEESPWKKKADRGRRRGDLPQEGGSGVFGGRDDADDNDNDRQGFGFGRGVRRGI